MGLYLAANEPFVHVFEFEAWLTRCATGKPTPADLDHLGKLPAVLLAVVGLTADEYVREAHRIFVLCR